MQYLFYNADGSFLVSCAMEDGVKMFRYVFDPNVPTVPSTELKVYSLEENKTIRQAMGEFQLSRPDVKVSYQVGMTGTDGITATDALRSPLDRDTRGKGP